MKGKMFMNKLVYTFFIAAMLYFATACSNGLNETSESAATWEETGDITSETLSEQPEKKEENIMKIEITIGEEIFSAEFYSNETAEKFIQMLPLTLDMSELNGNEKYFYLDSSLPANSSVPKSGIKSGDIMLYGSNCIVLFYDSFKTSYSYTPIGHIENADGLANALGKGSVTVTFNSVSE